MPRFFPCLAVSVLLLGLGGSRLASQVGGRDVSATSGAPGEISIADATGKKRVEIDGALFTEYRYDGLRQPILYPVLGPGGARMTRDYPMGSSPGEERDHPHHQSLWFAHGDVNGHDFWTGADGSRIAHVEFLAMEDGIRSRNRWEDGDGQVVCEDERVIRLGVSENGRWIDYGVTIHASHGALKFGDTKEGTMGIRMAPTLRLQGDVAQGSAVNSEGVTGRDVWGKRAKWVDYFGVVDEEVLGVAIFDHPDNPRFPTWWHARDYGLCAANPFGVHDFEGAERGTGDLVVEEGESVSFRYRFYFHRGDTEEGGVREQYEAFSASSPKR